MAVWEELDYRATAPRKAIAKLLEQKQDSFTVEALSEELPSVGRETAFRTINLLLEAGGGLQACRDRRVSNVQPQPG